MVDRGEVWPELRYADWKESCATLQLLTQIAGKVRMAFTPWLNHSWHVVLYVTPRGLTTSAIPQGTRIFFIDFDFIDHVLRISTSDGEIRVLPLSPRPVAESYAEIMRLLSELGIEARIDAMPSEIPDAIPFNKDLTHTAYERDAAHRFWRVLMQVDRVLKLFRTGFIGKASPVHFFWGSFDLAATRFSGRRAPPFPAGTSVPNMPEAVVLDAYSHECSSAGFWPGGQGADDAAFYSYAFPAPDGMARARVEPAQAFWNEALGQFNLPYEAVRTAPDPDAALLAFLTTTYEAAANLGKWDRAALECPLGEPGVPRKV